MSDCDISFVTVCKGRLPHLQQSLPCTLAQANTQCVVVDYNCPQGTAQWVRQQHPQVIVAKVIDVPDFALGRARNMGSQLAATPWLCFVDADCLLGHEFVAQLRPLLATRTFFTVEPAIPDLGGLVVVPRADFDAVGGYDEVFRGWGFEDTDLYVRLRLAGLRQRRFPARWASYIKHDDSLRSLYSPGSSKGLSARIHGMYMQIKTDLARDEGIVQISAADRQALFELVTQTLSLAPDEPASVTIDLAKLPGVRGADGWLLKRSRTYTYERILPAP